MYGIEIKPGDKRYVPLLHEALEGPTQALMAGSFLVENLPILQYVPAWVPGAGFQKKFAKWRKLAAELLELPFAEAKKTWVRPLAERCWRGRSLIAVNPAEWAGLSLGIA